MLKKHLFNYLFLILFLFSSSATFAAEDPIEMLQAVTQNVIIKLKSNIQTLKYNPEEVYPILDALVIPHIDFTEMGRWVVGRNAWHDADNATRESFLSAFKTFVVKNYTQFLLKFRNEKIQFFPLRADLKTQTDIKVSSQIIKEEGSPIRMDYRLILDGDAWKVYDIVIEDVSMLEGYQAQFAATVQDGGVGAVIEALQRHNAM